MCTILSATCSLQIEGAREYVLSNSVNDNCGNAGSVHHFEFDDGKDSFVLVWGTNQGLEEGDPPAFITLTHAQFDDPTHIIETWEDIRIANEGRPGKQSIWRFKFSRVERNPRFKINNVQELRGWWIIDRAPRGHSGRIEFEARHTQQMYEVCSDES